jgi:hypothetical protein
MTDKAKRPVVVAPVDWTVIADNYHRNLTPPRADQLCEQLHLPRLALDALPGIGFDPVADCWTYPEQDAAGRIVGILRRYSHGIEKPMPGSTRGLLLPDRWNERGTPLFIVDGFADALALSLCAISTISRPKGFDAVDMLADALSGFPDDRPVIATGDGAEQVAVELAVQLGRRIAWTSPPDGYGNFHGWILSQNPDPCILDDWHIIGESLWKN